MTPLTVAIKKQVEWYEIRSIRRAVVSRYRYSIYNLPDEENPLPEDAVSIYTYNTLSELIACIEDYHPTNCIKADYFPLGTALAGRDPNGAPFLWLITRKVKTGQNVLLWGMGARKAPEKIEWETNLALIPQWETWQAGDQPLPPPYPAHTPPAPSGIAGLLWALWSRIAPEKE